MKIKLLLFYSSAFFSIPFLADSKSGSAPNIVLIMADDMGYETLSSNGSESCKSPNLDRLAAEGIRFINCFSNPICTPSRVKIMTGQYNVRNYVKFGMLDREQTTFAHQLKSIGYKTCIAGNGNWEISLIRRNISVFKNPACGNTPVADDLRKAERESIADSSIPYLKSTAKKKILQTGSMVHRSALTSFVTLLKRTKTNLSSSTTR